MVVEELLVLVGFCSRPDPVWLRFFCSLGQYEPKVKHSPSLMEQVLQQGPLVCIHKVKGRMKVIFLFYFTSNVEVGSGVGVPGSSVEF